MHNQGDLELLTLWIVGKGGKCHKKNHHFDCSLYSIHSIDMTDLTIESNENREKRFAYLVLLLLFGYFRIRHFFIPRQQLHLYVSHKILLRTKLLRFQWHFRACQIEITPKNSSSIESLIAVGGPQLFWICEYRVIVCTSVLVVSLIVSNCSILFQ